MNISAVRRRSLSIAIHLLLVFGAVLISFILAEFIFRLFCSDPNLSRPEPPKILIHEASPNLKLLYKPSPNAQNLAYGVMNKINSWGFRDREFPLRKPEGVYRIIFLGDSVVYGYGIELQETLAKQLESLFQKTGKKIEVLNLGVSGYDSEQSVEFFKEVGLKFQPDLVLAGYTLNDSIYASMELDFFHDKLDLRVTVERSELKKKLFGFLFRHSQLLKYFDKKWQLQKRFKSLRSYREQSIWHFIEDRNIQKRDTDNSAYQQLKPEILKEAERLKTSRDGVKKMLGFIGIDNSDFYRSHWNVSKKAFEELKMLGVKHHFKVNAVIFPYDVEAEKYALGPAHHFLAQEFMGLGFGVIDLLPLLQSREYQLADLFSDPIHFSPLGSKYAAQMIYDELGNSI